MNKFLVFPCVKQNRKGYSGQAISLACQQNINFVLFFPIADSHAEIINYLLNNKPCDYDQNISTIGAFKTMIESWKVSGKFLSGIFMDLEYSSKTRDYTITMKLIVSDMNGNVDSVVKINFLYGIIIGAMERKEIVVSEDLLKKLTPTDEYLENNDNENDEENDIEEEIDDSDNAQYEKGIEHFKKMISKIDSGNENLKEENKKFPVDKNILKIAKQIMSGKRK